MAIESSRTSALLKGRAKPMKLFSDIDASAFAAVLMALVVIMMIVEPTTHHGIGPDLASVSHAILMPGATREDAIIVSVLRDGSIYCGHDKIALAQLHGKVLERLRDRSVERKVYIRADKRAPFGRLKEVMNGLSNTGIAQVGFLLSEHAIAVAAH
jgi:biopolymer transport protein ExbD/biopolymer transport protein TolR